LSSSFTSFHSEMLKLNQQVNVSLNHSLNRVSVVFGSTQSGKSSFINYIHSPDDPQSGPCKRGDSQTPCTIFPQILHLGFEAQILNLMDTPGLEDSKDDENIMNIYSKLNEFSEFSIPVLVHMFRRPFTDGCKKALKMYTQMMPGMFDKGLIIIISNFKKTTDFEDDLKFDKFDLQSWSTQFTKTIIESLALRVHPQLLFMNSLPRQSLDKVHSDSVRYFVLKKIADSPTLNFQLVKFKKPPGMSSRDYGQAQMFRGQVEGYRERIREENLKLSDDIDKQKRLQNRSHELKKIKDSINNTLRSINNNNKILISSFSTSNVWQFFYQEDEWDLITVESITQRVRTTTNKCEIRIIDESDKRDKGKFMSGFLKGTYGEVNLFTDSSIHNRVEIKDLEDREKKVSLEISDNDRDILNFNREHTSRVNELQQIQKKSNELMEKINELENELLSISEIRNRMRDFKLSQNNR